MSSASAAAQRTDWKARLEFQPTPALLHILSLEASLVSPEIKSACLELLALRDGSPASGSLAAPRVPQVPAPRATDESASAQPASVESPPAPAAPSEAARKRFDIRISDNEVLTGITSEQLVKGLQEGWLKGYDQLQTADGSKTLRQAFYHIKALRPHFDKERSFSEICAAWAAKLTFVGAVFWQIVGPLVRFGELTEDQAMPAAVYFLLWMIALFATTGNLTARRVVVIGGVFLAPLIAGLSFRSVLASLIMHPTTILVILGCTLGAWILVALAASPLDQRMKITAEREPIPEIVRAGVPTNAAVNESAQAADADNPTDAHPSR
jgi:hypothetical protein